MTLKEIRSITKQYNIKTQGKKKADLIREIQAKEGNFPCFGMALDGSCDQNECLWREDCLWKTTGLCFRRKIQKE